MTSARCQGKPRWISASGLAAALLLAGLTSCTPHPAPDAEQTLPAATPSAATAQAGSPSAGGDEAKAPGTEGGPDQVELPPAAGLLDAYLVAIGGPDAVASIKTLYLEGKIDTGAQQITASTKLWWSEGRFYLEEEVPGFGMAKSGYDGKIAWVSDPIFGLRSAEGVEREQLIRNAAIFELVDWERHFISAATTGTAIQDGVEVFEVKLTTKMGDVVVVGLGKDDHLLRTISLVQHSPQGDQPVKVVRSDYRPINGVMMPYQQTAQVSLFTMVEEVVKAEVNVPVDESKFAMPGASTVVDAKGNLIAPAGGQGAVEGMVTP